MCHTGGSRGGRIDDVRITKCADATMNSGVEGVQFFF